MLCGLWELYRALPAEVRRLARKNYRILRENPWHPGLHFTGQASMRFWELNARRNAAILPRSF
jgi:hypothetical protein